MTWLNKVLHAADAVLFALLGALTILAAIDHVWAVVPWLCFSAGLAAYRFITEGGSQ